MDHLEFENFIYEYILDIYIVAVNVMNRISIGFKKGFDYSNRVRPQTSAEIRVYVPKGI